VKPTNDLSQEIRESLTQRLGEKGYDLLGLTPILSSHQDRTQRYRSLQEALKEFDDLASDETEGYLVRIRKVANAPQSEHETATSAIDEVYLPNGHLNTPFLLKNAEVLLQAGETKLAARIYQTLLQNREHLGRAHEGLGDCAAREEKMDLARRAYEEAIAYDPTTPVLLKLAKIYDAQGQYASAGETYERALLNSTLLGREKAKLHLKASQTWRKLKERSKSRSHLLQAIALSTAQSEKSEILAQLGEFHRELGEIEEARHFFEESLALVSTQISSLNGLGYIHLSRGEQVLAQEYFERSLAQNIQQPSILVDLVRAAYQTRRYAPAAVLLKDYIDQSPFNAHLLYSLAGLYFHLGSDEHCAEVLEKIFELSPQFETARGLKSRLEARMQQKGSHGRSQESRKL
jgi:tetratricopeptide (TPR) repeat protein